MFCIQDSIGLWTQCLITIVFNILTYSIIFLTNMLIWRKSRQALMPGQQQSREISRQVGHALLVQALFPLALSLLPTFLINISLLLAGSEGWDCWLMVPNFQYWAGLVNPVATILIVSQYRNVLVKALGKTSSAAAVQQPIMCLMQQRQQQNRLVQITGDLHLQN
jgi:hypothetical protein